MISYLTDYIIAYGPIEELVVLYEGQEPKSLLKEIEDFCAVNLVFCANVNDDTPGFPRLENGRRLLVVLDNPNFDKAIKGCDEILLIVEEKKHKDFSQSKLWESLRTKYESITIAYLRRPYENEVLVYRQKGEIELSVILPVYNVAKYLPQCIASISKWDAPYVEYLFVDDGSSDDSAKIIEEASKKDPRIKLLQKSNGGCASARNFGLKAATGKYIGFLDSDDFIEPDMFEKLFHRAMDGDYDIAYCGFKYFYNETQKTENVPDNMEEAYIKGTRDLKLIDSQIAYRRIGIWRAIYSRRLIEENGITFNEKLPRFDDLPFKVMTQAKALGVVCVPEYLYCYRLNRPGQDVSADDRRLYVHFEIFKQLDDFFKKPRDVQQLEYYIVVKLDTHVWALSKIKDEFRDEYLRLAKEDLLRCGDAEKLKNIVSVYCGRKQRKALNKILESQ